MLNFEPITLDMCERIKAALHAAPDRGCEYTFGNLYIWRETYDTKVAWADGFMFIRFDKDTLSYLFPVGDGDLKTALDAVDADAVATARPFHIIAARKEDCDELERLCPGRFKFHTARDFSEYVYNSADLIELKGKKYHGKRNHISRFWEEYPDARFVEITRDNISRVENMNETWYNKNLDGDCSLSQEKRSSESAFRDFFELGFSGGYLETGGNIVAFSMGEPINEKTFCVHFEKADYDVDGAYTVINREFAEHFCSGYEFVNREDDVGDEGLRRAKLSYYPAVLTDKYVVTEI